MLARYRTEPKYKMISILVNYMDICLLRLI